MNLCEINDDDVHNDSYDVDDDDLKPQLQTQYVLSHCCIKQLNFWLLYMQIGSDFFFNKKHKEDSFKIYIIMKNIDTEIY